MDDVLVIGAGPAGLLAAWIAAQRGAKARVLARGIGTTHVSPGWLGVLDTGDELPAALDGWVAARPQHPYALAGLEALRNGVAALRGACAPSGLNYVGDLNRNYRLPTALGAVKQAALAPESFVAGDLNRPGKMLIAAPAGWRDFYPDLCAANLSAQGCPARGLSFELPELHTGQFDPTANTLANLFELPEIRAKAAAQIRPRLEGAARVGLPAVLGVERAREAWQDMQDRLGVPVFEIPTLPPCVPGIRLYNALTGELKRLGVQVLLDMAVERGAVEGGRAVGAVVPGPVRELTFRARQLVLATGGLYGGGVASNYRGELWEAVFGLPLQTPDSMGEWFDDTFLGDHAHQIHHTGVYANEEMQPLDADGRVVLENVRVAGRILGGYNPLREGSTEGVWLATAYRAACCL